MKLKVSTELEEFTGSMAANSTGAVGSQHAVITKSVDAVEGMSAGSAPLARAARCLPACWRFFSFSEVGEEEKGETFTKPPLLQDVGFGANGGRG